MPRPRRFGSLEERDDRRLATTAGALVLALALAVSVVAGWHWVRNADQRRGDDVRQRLERLAARGAPRRVGDLLDEHFDRLIVVPGTASATDVRRALGFGWRRASEVAYRCCDPAPIWILTRGRSVIAYVRLGLALSYGDGIRPGGYRPTDRLAFHSSSANGHGIRVTQALSIEHGAS